MTIDEILAAMPEPAAVGDHEYLVIDPASRTISVPESEAVFAVTGDENADRKYFICPRIVGDGLDLSGMFIRVNYRNANGEEDGYLVKDVAVEGEYVTFSWLLSKKVAAYMGAIQFGVCADLPNTADRRYPDWNTTMASGEVLKGLHPDDGDVEAETSDVVTQLREEIAASTAAVEACGAEQIQAVKNAAAAETAAAEAQVAAKGAETLATIPADYSTMAGKVNEQANAIKGHLSGEIVRADDVSPVEHFLGVKVRGKNLFDTSKIPTATPSVSYAYISEVGVGRIVVRTEEGYDGNGYCTVAKTLREVCPSLEVGKTYVLTASTESNSTNMYLPGIQKSWIFGKAMVMTEAVLNSAMTFYGLSAREGLGTGDCVISNIQIEEGTEATEYTPYIDPAGVTVTRCGKNLFDAANHSVYTENATVNSENGRTYDVTGATGNTAMAYSAGAFRIKFSRAIYIAEKITVSLYVTLLEQGMYDNRVRIFAHDGTKNLQYATAELAVGVRKKVTLVCDTVGDTLTSLLVYLNNNRISIEVGTVQVETGDTATDYEPYNGATAMPAEDGTVAGLPSAAPTMTLLTDTPGVVIECTYNRDSNAVYAELLAKIAALSGTN